MPFHVPINILDFIFKGMLIGMIASAPMGPVGILCVQRTLNKGRWYGFATGIGAAVSDIFYAGITGLGMTFVMDLVDNPQNRFYLQIIGSLMLLGFGWYTYRTDPTKNMHQSGQRKVRSPITLVDGLSRHAVQSAHRLPSSWPSMPSLPLCCPTIRLRCWWAS